MTSRGARTEGGAGGAWSDALGVVAGVGGLVAGLGATVAGGGVRAGGALLGLAGLAVGVPSGGVLRSDRGGGVGRRPEVLHLGDLLAAVLVLLVLGHCALLRRVPRRYPAGRLACGERTRRGPAQHAGPALVRLRQDEGRASSLTVWVADLPSSWTLLTASVALPLTCWAASVAEPLRSCAMSWPTDLASSISGWPCSLAVSTTVRAALVSASVAGSSAEISIPAPKATRPAASG